MKDTFYLPKIETRSTEVDGIPTYIVRGYAAIPEHIYPYKHYEDRTFKEFFSERALESINKKAKMIKVFADIEHVTGAKETGDYLIKQIAKKTGKDFSKELDHLQRKFKYADIPMFKVEEIKIDENGLFVDIRGNPFYREADEEHKHYFDSVWGSLKNGFINGMSLNFKPTDTTKVNENLTQIDDVDITGISLTAGACNDMANITEVAMRCLENIRGESECQIQKRRMML